MDTVRVQLVDTVQVVNNSMQSGGMDLIVTTATVIIACAAVFIPLYQILTTRKHNRLSDQRQSKIPLMTIIIPYFYSCVFFFCFFDSSRR